MPAVPAVPGPPELQFLHMTSLLKFFETVNGNPMHAFTRLVGALGPCGTRAVRADDCHVGEGGLRLPLTQWGESAATCALVFSLKQKETNIPTIN